MTPPRRGRGRPCLTTPSFVTAHTRAQQAHVPPPASVVPMRSPTRTANVGPSTGIVVHAQSSSKRPYQAGVPSTETPLERRNIGTSQNKAPGMTPPGRQRGRPRLAAPSFVTAHTQNQPHSVSAASSSSSAATTNISPNAGHVIHAENSSRKRPNQAGVPSTESPVKRRNINKRKAAFAASTTVLNLGDANETCGYCQARVWPQEFTGRYTGNGPKGYSICCGKGKIQLPLLKETPPELRSLLQAGGSRSRMFEGKKLIYNNIFSFTSFGGNIDRSLNNGSGPFVFRVRGHTCHNIGSLKPPDGCEPKFAQLYMYDGQEEIDMRLQFPGANEIDASIVQDLSNMLERENALVKIYRQVRERFRGVQQTDACLRLFERRVTDGRYANIPARNDYEFAAVVVDNDFVNRRDILVNHKKFGLQRVNELHPCFMSLQYPLLFPRGEDGYRINIMHRGVDPSNKRPHNTVSMRAFHAYRLQYRDSEGHTLIHGGRLFLQYVVDAWCNVERVRLNWVHTHQSEIRSDLYNNVVDSLHRGDVSASDIGQRVVLPSSFTGGYRYMQQNFQDSLAVCKEYGHPDLFITFTCNPKWEEIQNAVRSSGSQDASVRPDIIARVFKIKLDMLLSDLTKKDALGRVRAVVYTVEFQKRGLPHAHIVMWLADGDKLTTPEDIDVVVCAEIPDKENDVDAYNVVSQFMMHGPCGQANPRCPCMQNNMCTKYYPKPFTDATHIDDDGYAAYRRRDTGKTVEVNKVFLDNRHVVPYNRGLLVKYQAHINTEWCNHSQSIKYLFKYIGKGPDTATATVEPVGEARNSANGHEASFQNGEIDEVKNYVTGRYVSASEASWRLFEFPIHHREPFVQRLYFHLEDEQEVRFRDNETLPEIVRRTDPDGTMLIQWFLNNHCDPRGLHLTFAKYPTLYRWEGSEKRWYHRQHKVPVVGRMVAAHPSSGERFYMRMLLNIVTGAKDFEDIRTVDGIVYTTYKEACFHRGLLESDNEWHIALGEASAFANAFQLRDLFVTLLIFCEVSNPVELWARHWQNLSDDIEYKRRKVLKLPNLKISNADRQMLTLIEINNLLKQYGKNITDYPGFPALDPTQMATYANHLLLEEMMYDCNKLKLEASQRIGNLNHMQRVIFEKVVQDVATNNGGLYFVYGHGGTGKTFLWSTIISKLRSEGKIVLAVASSGIASLLVEGGRTAHSRFKIPIDLDEFSCCAIKKNTHLAELICKASLVLWDEAPMNHRYVFEAVDRTFRDILSNQNPQAATVPFGGMTMLLGGDFRQTLPVVSRMGREATVAASLTKSNLWKSFKLYPLIENMRVGKDVPPVTVAAMTLPFRDWVLRVGDGKEKSFDLEHDGDNSWIHIPEELQVAYDCDPVCAIADEIYGELVASHGDTAYLRDRAILTPLNEHVEVINQEVLKRLPGQSKRYRSCDTICKGSTTSDAAEALYPTEYLNSLRFSGMPNHEIELKIGAPIMLLRNLNPKKGLCNGTRLIVTRCYPFLIEALIITGNKIGDIACIPRITMTPADKTYPFVLKRKQFPVALCYAMTINKSQGQTMKNVGLYLPSPVFSHGQLYVAISRVTTPSGLKIVCANETPTTNGYTKNVVYREIFSDIDYL